MWSIKEHAGKALKTSILLFLLLTVVNVVPDTSFNDWDSNNNSKISMDEFQSHFVEHYYSDWDMNDDKHLDDEDFYRMTFKVLDSNNNDRLDFSESKWGYDYLYGDYVDYEVAVKKESDSEIDYRTFYRSIYESGYYRDFDSDNDGHLNENELAKAIYTTWDIDGNGYLSNNEFTTFNNLYLET